MDRFRNVVFALDETGNFDDPSFNGKLMVAGIVYDDEGIEYACDREKRRLCSFYRECYKKALGTDKKFPEHMHYDHVKGNATQVNKVKKEIIKGLPDFFGASEGKYQIYVYFKSARGMEDVYGSNELEQESFAANLYFHLVQRSVSRTLFHNPCLSVNEINSISLEPATRSSDARKKEEEYETLGYGLNADGNLFQTMTMDVYRMILINEMSDGSQSDIHIERIKGMRLNSRSDEKELIEKSFFYLSDVLCTAIKDECPSMTANSNSLQIIERYLAKLNPSNQSLVYAYDDIDEYFHRAWKKYEQEDYFGVLSALNICEQDKGECIEYYKQKWIALLWERMERDLNDTILSDLIKKLRLQTRQKEVATDKLLYIVEKTEQLYDKVKGNKIDLSIMYDFYNAASNLSNHRTLLEKGEEYRKKRDQYQKYCSIDTMIEGRNSSCVAMNDHLAHESAYKQAKETVEYCKVLHQIREKLVGEKGSDRIYAKSLSQFGQSCGFLYGKEKDTAILEEGEEAFKKALSCFEQGTDDYYITMSYLLHLYIIWGKSEAFEKMYIEYLDGVTGKEEQLEYILEKKQALHHKNWMFALYLYVKGIYTFWEDVKENYSSEIGKRLQMLSQSVMQENEKKMLVHPWELIFCYIARIRNKKDKSQVNMGMKKKSILDSVYEMAEMNEGLLASICWFGLAQYYEQINDEEEYKEYLLKTMSSIGAWDENDKEVPLSKIREIVETYIGYMYC